MSNCPGDFGGACWETRLKKRGSDELDGKDFAFHLE